MEQLDEFMAGGSILGGFSIGTIVVLLGVLAISAAAGISSRRVLFPRLMNLISKTDRIDGKSLLAPASLGWMVGFLVFTLSIDWLTAYAEPTWDSGIVRTLNSYSYAGFVLLMLVAAYRLVDYLDAFIVVEGENLAARRSLASVAESVGRVTVVVCGVFIMAGLAGVNLSGLIAGLGITGLALALAAKDTVANIFGAISILIDQPFNVGDWIIVDGVEGEVVTIALRTTLIRTSADTLVTVPNSNITNSSVENFSQRRFRRIRPSYEFEASSDQQSIRDFCGYLLEEVTSDPRSTKKDDSWVRISSVGPSKIIVQTNFYCDSSSKSEREMKEDVALMAKSGAAQFGLKFHEPRFRESHAV
tara:strand:+ start:1163 stop:2242 length:1080 start_codon:yes stop_codon:yes gene_type:complete